MGGFCEKLLPSDRWPWSDVSGLQHRPLDGVALPSLHWEWESDWYVDENFGGEPTEKGVGELASLRASPWGGSVLGSAPSIPQCCPHCPVAADLSLRPATPRMLPRVAGDGALGHVAVPSLSSSLPPTFLSFLPQETLQSPLGISGVDVCHRLPCHLHQGQEVEFLRAEAAVDPVQEIQVPRLLGQGRACGVGWGQGGAQKAVTGSLPCPPHHAYPETLP